MGTETMTTRHGFLPRAARSVRPLAKPGRMPAILALSARDEDAVRRRATTLGKALRGYAEVDLPDVAWTLAAGRRALGQELASWNRFVSAVGLVLAAKS